MKNCWNFDKVNWFEPLYFVRHQNICNQLTWRMSRYRKISDWRIKFRRNPKAHFQMKSGGVGGVGGNAIEQSQFPHQILNVAIVSTVHILSMLSIHWQCLLAVEYEHRAQLLLLFDWAMKGRFKLLNVQNTNGNSVDGSKLFIKFEVEKNKKKNNNCSLPLLLISFVDSIQIYQ